MKWPNINHIIDFDSILKLSGTNSILKINSKGEGYPKAYKYYISPDPKKKTIYLNYILKQYKI